MTDYESWREESYDLQGYRSSDTFASKGSNTCLTWDNGIMAKDWENDGEPQGHHKPPGRHLRAADAPEPTAEESRIGRARLVKRTRPTPEARR